MTRENRTENAPEKRNEYAYWAIPGTDAAITYSLPLFHEIDFAVNEGYRKIPHGGVEEGGLLFGKMDAQGTRVEMFRPIACEHASGPSLLLSERDLKQLSAQIEGAAQDSDLEGLELVGWFLAHTRGVLILTDHEVKLCDRYFARPGMLTVLVKPERFQPTRFAFLVRGKDGSLPRDGNEIILPLPGRSVKAASGPVPSILAPTVNAAAARRAAETEAAERGDELDEAPQPAPSAPVMEAKPAASPPLLPVEAETQAPSVPLNRSARRQRRLSIEQVRPRTEDEQETYAAEVESSGGSHDVVGVPVPPPLIRRGGELEPVPRAMVAAATPERALRTSPQEVEEIDGVRDPYRQVELLNEGKPASTAARLVMVLPLAALLGCLVGYIAYLQVPSPIIRLSVKSRGENVIVTWPPEQTVNAVYAAVRVDNSMPVMLTPEEKSTGRVEVQARADMKVELIARNWIHDSRGIVHFLKPVANTGQ